MSTELADTRGRTPPAKRVEWAPILKWLLDEINSLDYSPSTRWCFYRIMDRYKLPKSAWGTFKATQSIWRKGFREGWRPDTLTDSVREVNYAGYGPSTMVGFYEELLEDAPTLGIWGDLPFYPEVWFEADAMDGQFEHYVRDAWRITTRPFRGDYSVEKKYQAANDLLAMAKKGKAITILYFGDCDTKGKVIPYGALKDIKSWSNVPVNWIKQQDSDLPLLFFRKQSSKPHLTRESLIRYYPFLPRMKGIAVFFL